VRNAVTSKDKLRLWIYLLKTAREVENGLRERLRTAHETTLPRFDVMAMLHRTPDGLRMSELSDQLMVSNGNVTGIVGRLAEDGMITRVSEKGDRRARHVKLTKKGRLWFESLAADHENWIDAHFKGLDHDEIDAVIDTLLKIRKEYV